MIYYVQKNENRINILGSVYELEAIPQDCTQCTYNEYLQYQEQMEIQMYGTIEERGLREKLEEIRNIRKYLFKAFDIYKVNVLYGIELQSVEDGIALDEWYASWLNLPEEITLQNYEDIEYPQTPSVIEYYL